MALVFLFDFDFKRAKNAFQNFSFISKKVQGFPMKENINVAIISAFSSTKSQFFAILIFIQDIWGSVLLSP